MFRDYLNDKKRKWYIYILDIDNSGKKQHTYGRKRFFYTGITLDIGKRYGDYLYRRKRYSEGKDSWINKRFPLATKTLVAVFGPIFDIESVVMLKENSIKKLTKIQKIELIKSKKNILFGCFLEKRKIIIWKNTNKEEQEEIKVM